ncbi:MAG: ribulose-phosphate 3-epimerase, partial [Lentisphaerota bacterium]
KMARQAVKIPLNVHLMVSRPDIYAEPFIQAGATTLSIHIEADCQPGPVLEAIRKAGVRAGITLNPETPAEAVWPLLGLADEILCMTVHPGFGGQAFIPEVLPKIAEIRARAPAMDISVDGGLDEETCAACAAEGANIFLIGSTLYKAKDMTSKINTIRDRIDAARKASSHAVNT